MGAILKIALIALGHADDMSARYIVNGTEVTTTNRRNFIIASVLSVAVLMGGSSTVLSVLAQDERTGPGKRPPAGEPPWMSQLTDEQKTEIQQLIESLRASGATREEIRDAVNAKLQEWGIEIPEMPTPPSISGE